MNENRYRDALVAYSKTLPPTLPDEDREKVLQAYLEELVEADISQVTAQGTARLEQDSENVRHDIQLQAARNALG